MKKKQFAIIGGDNRIKHAAVNLALTGSKVNVFGLDISGKYDNINRCERLDGEMFSSDVFVLPIPYKNQNGDINIIDWNIHLKPEDLFSQMRAGAILFYAKGDDEITNLCSKYKIYGYDILKEETFAVLNAIPTAEGAIQRAMERTDITLHGAKILILGYGRIGKILSKMLNGIGSNVTIAARRAEDLALIKANGYQAIPINELDAVLGEPDIVFNTIPARILNRCRLMKLQPDCCIIDLASFPGGLDFEAAKEIGLNVSHELGLPGTVAPRTAANIICQVIENILFRHSFTYPYHGGV
jgi:dipicolinate synthase subunit A